MTDASRGHEPRSGVGPGFLLVVAAAALWGSDALFRRGLALELPAATVVFYEHLVLAVLLGPRLRSVRQWAGRLRPSDWVSVLLIGIGASAVATMLFTMSFAAGDPTTPILLQKLQPLIAVGGAALLLGERLRPRFGVYVLAALAGAYLVSLPDPTAVSVAGLRPALLAVGAAALWGMGTVLGRRLTGDDLVAPGDLTALRFVVGLPAAAVIALWNGGPSSLVVSGQDDAVALVLLALIPGLLAMSLYYRGLATTPASTATLGELAFPFTAVLVGWAVFDSTLSTTQWLGLLLLAGTVARLAVLSRTYRLQEAGVVVPERTVPTHAG